MLNKAIQSASLACLHCYLQDTLIIVIIILYVGKKHIGQINTEDHTTEKFRLIINYYMLDIRNFLFIAVMTLFILIGSYTLDTVSFNLYLHFLKFSGKTNTF